MKSGPVNSSEVAFGIPIAGGSVEHRLGSSVPGHFLE